jgi:phytoene dehydrogenase-like protein
LRRQLVTADHFSIGPDKSGISAASREAADVAAPPVDAVVVGAGPNGLTAAALLAHSGRSVTVFEGSDVLGGGARTEELTLPGFAHDVCSAIHPLAAGSPAFAPLHLRAHGLALAQPELALAHPLDDGNAGALAPGFDATDASLGPDAAQWATTFRHHARRWTTLVDELAGPLLHVPRHPLALARFGIPGLAPATTYARTRFREPRARALFMGMAAHSVLPLSHAATASFALVLGAAGHAVGWPAIKGGSQRLTDVLASIVRAHGGEIVTGTRVHSLDELPPARAVFLDTSPIGALQIAHDRLGTRVRRALGRFRRGPAAFKLDFALSEPIPWTAEPCRRAGTVHLGGTAEEIVAAEDTVARGHHPERPFVLVAQPSIFDDTRAPAGKHTLWAYCHVPNGSTVDMTEAIERQLDRFAPDWRDTVLQRHVLTPSDFEARNPNKVGGDFAGGALTGVQLVSRPRLARDPYRLADGVYLCSASTPPGAGVHGMCGAAAVQRAERRELRPDRLA